MRRYCFLCLMLICGWWSVVAGAGETLPPPGNMLDELKAPSVQEHWRQGETVARAFAQLTGEAMCPFLGLGAHGAWVYFRTDEMARDGLAWHYQPWCWGIMLGLAALVLLNATLGEAATPVIKKPLDAIGEIIEVGGAAVALPTAAWIFAGQTGEWFDRVFAGAHLFPQALAADHLSTTAVVGGSAMFLAGAAVALVVWLCWHVIDVFILISPIPFIDAGLRGARVVTLGCLVGLTALNPYLGAAAALLIVIGCALISGWCGRRLLYFWHYAYDTLCVLFARTAPVTLPLRAFSGAGLACARRTCGRLNLGADGAIIFAYRRFGVLPRVLKLPLNVYWREGKIVAADNPAGAAPQQVPIVLLPVANAQPETVKNLLHLREIDNGRVE